MDIIEVTAVKKLRHIQRSRGQHWVGDGFPVRTLFGYSSLGAELSPFLLFDYAGPMVFPPTDKRLGVGEHPHRGFETVTIVYSGEVEHRDSSGGGGGIGPGDVQWMTAASGLVHEEMHSRGFAKRGGMFEMVQLWVNLPAKDKMSLPRYQNIMNRQIPVVDLPGGQGVARVIAGTFGEVAGPARTFTPINVWDLRLTGGREIRLPVPDGHTTLLAVLKGSVRLEGEHGLETLESAEVGLFHREGDHVRLEGSRDATVMLLSGAPIDEPIVGSGPFVMNSAEEIRQAIMDYQRGRMGRIPIAEEA